MIDFHACVNEPQEQLAAIGNSCQWLRHVLYMMRDDDDDGKRSNIVVFFFNFQAGVYRRLVLVN